MIEPARQGSGAAPPRAFRSRWKRRLGLAAFTFLAALASAAALAPWLFSPSALLEAIAGELQSSSGLYVATRGRTVFALTPRPHISIEGVAFADRNGALIIEADQLHGILDLLPLITGRLEVGALALVKPRVKIDLDRKPIDAPGAAARAAAARPASPEAQKADKARLGLLAIVDGELRVKRNGRDHHAENINITLDWRRIGQAATLSGKFDWRGERLETLFWVAQPAALLRGEQSVATASLSGADLHFEAQGLAQLGANARFSGRVAGSAASAREALRLFEISAPLPGPLADSQLTAQAFVTARDAQLQDLHLVIDGNAVDGAATLRFDEERPNLTARLKSNYVSFKPMLLEFPALTASDGQWSRETFDVRDLSGADVDVALDAAHARLGRLAVDDAVVSLLLRRGAVDIALTKAQAYRGEFRARAEFHPTDHGPSAHVVAQAARVDAAAMLWDVFGAQALGGAMDANVTLDATGADMAAMMQSLCGRIAVNLKDGEIAGVDLARALRRMEKRPLASAQDIRSGHSPIDAASATISVDKGVGSIEDGAARGPGFSLAFAGSVNFAERGLALKAIAREADGAGNPRDNDQSISFDLGGSWDDLALKPDTQAFIRRSDAAAPLLPRATAPTPAAPPPH